MAIGINRKSGNGVLLDSHICLSDSFDGHDRGTVRVGG
jgi:hypothetical protein